MRLRTRAACAGIAALTLASAAWATIPDGSGNINSCYSKSTGTLRVVDSATSCRSGETALSWNQQGRMGPIGPPGPAGPANPTYVSEQEVSFASDQGRTATFTGPAVPAGEYSLQISVAPFTSFGTTTADVKCGVNPIGQGAGLSDSAHLDRSAGIDGASFSWTEHGSTFASSTPIGRVDCSVVSGDGSGFLGFHTVMVATRIG